MFWYYCSPTETQNQWKWLCHNDTISSSAIAETALQGMLILALLTLPTLPPKKKLIESWRFPRVALVGAGGSGPLDPPPAQRRPWQISSDVQEIYRCYIAVWNLTHENVNTTTEREWQKAFSAQTYFCDPRCRCRSPYFQLVPLAPFFAPLTCSSHNSWLLFAVD